MPSSPDDKISEQPKFKISVLVSIRTQSEVRIHEAVIILDYHDRIDNIGHR